MNLPNTLVMAFLLGASGSVNTGSGKTGAMVGSTWAAWCSGLVCAAIF